MVSRPSKHITIQIHRDLGHEKPITYSILIDYKTVGHITLNDLFIMNQYITQLLNRI